MIIRPILEKIVEDIKFDELPIPWNSINVKDFSSKKNIWDFQQNAIKNGVKCLYLFYKECGGDKRKLYEKYVYNNLDEELEKALEIDFSDNKRSLKEMIRKYYGLNEDRLGFQELVNRAAFWMATGSGKTLVIIKLIEALKILMDVGEIPKKDILFLTHREDLINQFKKHVDEFNEYSIKRGFKIHLVDLLDYEKVKRNTLTPFFDELVVFYYKSDCISDEQKEKIVDFRNYENGGNWYIFLDEAHKGDKKDSKRQFLYSIMARNGFIFNFSATFVDPIDVITTVFNFNLERFISAGYGKHIYIMQQEVRAFREKEDYNDEEKKKIVLKTLILLTYLKKIRERIKIVDENAYHEPMMLTLVNTVNLSKLNKKDIDIRPDLKLFFDQLEKIGKGEVSEELFEESKKEIIDEFSQNSRLIYEDCDIKIEKRILDEIKIKDILYHVYNSDSCGAIEVLTIPGNRQEAVLKLKTTNKPFALIKIGDVIRWIKENLVDYEVSEKYEYKSIFENIEKNEEINILMGSRAFYEGWDSNRPNVILYINIGVGEDAKKFVLQSIGRGVRIEPVKEKRKRLLNLYNSGEDNGLYMKLCGDPSVQSIETLFVFGTKRDVLEKIIEHLETEKVLESIIELRVNPVVENYLLLVPIYKNVGKIYKQANPQKFTISTVSLNLLSDFLNSVDDRIIIVSYDVEPEVYKHIKNSLSKAEEFYKIDEKARIPLNLLLAEIVKHFNLEVKDIEKFKKLEDEIVHFKKIRVIFSEEDRLNDLRKKIFKVSIYSEKETEEKKLKELYGKVSPEEYDKKKEEIMQKYSKKEEFDNLEIKYIAEHYYNPVIISKTEKIEYIKHIIKTKSEREFINKLEEFVSKKSTAEFDWWLFSKIDESLDKIYIPYYSPKNNQIRCFYPDFIFWFKKRDRYYIVFVDPKGIEHTDFELKIDGFKRIFEKDNKSKIFEFEGLKITVHLMFFVEDRNKVPEQYRKYCIDNVESIFSLV